MDSFTNKYMFFNSAYGLNIGFGDRSVYDRSCGTIKSVFLLIIM